jgi:integrase
MLALRTARRESELLGLRWTDVAWERGELRVERQLKRLHGSWYLEGIKTGERGESTIRLPESRSTCSAAIKPDRTRPGARLDRAGPPPGLS